MKLKSKLKNRKRNGAPKPASAAPPLQLWHPDVPGPLWDGTGLVPRRQIESYCQVVAREFRPQKIILFGSYAYGKPTTSSDVDLVVIMPFRGSEMKKMGEIRGRVEAPFPMDLLVWPPERMRKDDSFTREVMTLGKVMHES